jgi:hypothetical protein
MQTQTTAPRNQGLEIKMKFAKWINTKTNQTRIYVNGNFGYGIKVFVVDGGPSGTNKFGSEGFPEIVINADFMIGQSKVDSISDQIDEFVKNAVPSEVNPVFNDYLSLTK